jgi:LemA protein
MKKAQGTLIGISAALVIVLAIVAAVFVINYNSIVTFSNAVDEAKGQVETVLERRLALIPNLVETVKGYAAHERNTLEAVIKARGAAESTLKEVNSAKTLGKEEMAKLNSSQTQLTGAINNLLAIVEQYPDLKANANFLALQDQLEGTENRISVERQRYNSIVRAYNTKLTVFPSNIISGLMSFKPREYFEAQKDAQQAPQVKF